MITTLDKACLSTQLFDLNGWLYMKGIDVSSSDIRRRERRVNRVKTLDASVYLDDLGFAHGDRTIVLNADITQDDEDILFNIVENHALIWISLTDGAFSASIESATVKGTRASIRILLKEAA